MRGSASASATVTADGLRLVKLHRQRVINRVALTRGLHPAHRVRFPRLSLLRRRLRRLGVRDRGLHPCGAPAPPPDCARFLGIVPTNEAGRAGSAPDTEGCKPMDATEPAVDSPRPHAAGVSRRTIVTVSAWAVPAIVATTGTPAFAGSGPTVTASSADMRAPASGATVVSALVKDAGGSALVGAPVAFSGPTGTSFSPATATTNAAGIATSTLTTTDSWALPGGTLSVTALSGGASGIAVLTILGANAYMLGDNRHGAAPGASTLAAPSQLKQAFPSPIVSIVTGAGPTGPFALAVLQDGTVWSVGDNGYGQLGDGTTTSRSTWAKIATLSTVTQVAAGGYSAYALLADGTVRAWGNNGSAQLGNGSTNNAAIYAPLSVQGLGGAVVKQIAAGDSTAFARLADGTVRAWGSNGTGQLGAGSSVSNSPTPVTVSGITTAVQIASAEVSTFALLSDGSVRGWGANRANQLGDGTTDNRASPVTVQNITTATRISAGRDSGLALLSDGTLRAWGRNADGQLGDGTTTNRSAAVPIPNLTNVVAIASGRASAYASLSDGTLRAWGKNGAGQLGDGTTTDRTSPVTVSVPVNPTLMPDGYLSDSLSVLGALVPSVAMTTTD